MSFRIFINTTSFFQISCNLQMHNAFHAVGRVHSRPLRSDFHRLLHWLCRSEHILFARFSGHGVYLKRLVQLTTPPSELRFANCHIQFSRCYVIQCPLYSSRDILRFDKKFFEALYTCTIFKFVFMHFAPFIVLYLRAGDTLPKTTPFETSSVTCTIGHHFKIVLYISHAQKSNICHFCFSIDGVQFS